MKRTEIQTKQYIVNGFACFVLAPLLTLACSRDLSSFSTESPKNSGDANLGAMSACKGKTENFPIQASYRGKLDIVVAIDSKQGTEESRKQVVNNMRPLIKKLGDSDYQIAIISGALNACVKKVITKNTPKAVEELGTAIEEALKDGGGEYINMKAITALTGVMQANRDKQNHTVTNTGMCTNEHSDWLRDDSVVAIIIISGNKHLCCEPLACTMIDIEKSLQDINRLGDSSSDRKLYRLYGLLNQGTPYNKTEKQPDHTLGSNWYVDWSDFESYNLGGGYEVSTASKYLADFVKSIDDNDYKKIFDDITDDLATSLGDTFTLAETPDGSCVDVFLTSEGKKSKLSADEYEVDGKTLQIKKVLTAKDTEVSIIYNH